MKTTTAIIIGSVLASLIIGIALYSVQTSKQESIEAQKYFQSRVDSCESLTAGIMKQWGNIIGVTYNAVLDYCEVTYLDGESKSIMTANLDYMITAE